MSNQLIQQNNNEVPKIFTPPSNGEVVSVGPRVYIIGSPLDGGSFGKVYNCTDMWGNELVAKVIQPNGLDYESVKQKWLREYNNMLYVRHPNITSIYDAFEWRDTFYIVMEKCHITLEQLFKRK